MLSPKGLDAPKMQPDSARAIPRIFWNALPFQDL
jgi:hypothetical protein